MISMRRARPCHKGSRDCGADQAGGQQDGLVRATRQAHDDLGVGDGDPSRRIQEAPKELARAYALVAVERRGEEPIDAAANEREQNIEVDVQGHGRGEGVEVKKSTLSLSMRMFQFDEVMTLVAVLLGLVLAVDVISSRIRAKVLA